MKKEFTPKEHALLLELKSKIGLMADTVEHMSNQMWRGGDNQNWQLDEEEAEACQEQMHKCLEGIHKNYGMFLDDNEEE